MHTYSVTWEIKVEADDPVEAGARALNEMLDPGNEAFSFTVKDEIGSVTEVETI